MDLRDYFAASLPTVGAAGLTSISYNPDARYAFVNFNSAAARIAALEQAASRLFGDRRLDCRIRGDSASRSTKVNYGHAQATGNRNKAAAAAPAANYILWHKVEELSHFPESDRAQWGQDKYFIIKSVSLQALCQSLETGKWYIPKRHAGRLNHAFQSSNTVYFVFSVNGSGEFFGSARMTSEIDTVEDDDVGFTSAQDAIQLPTLSHSQTKSRTLSQTSSESVSSTSTTSNSGSGSIYYEPERRRVIWEATQNTLEHEELHDPLTGQPSSSSASSLSFNSVFSAPDPLLTKLSRFSNPCTIKWLSARAVPFSATRGLHNAWNEDRPVHVARNVTAVEPRVGAALLRLWHSPQTAEAEDEENEEGETARGLRGRERGGLGLTSPARNRGFGLRVT